MDSTALPILSLIVFSPLLGIALAAVFRNAGNGAPAKIVALLSSVVTFVLSLHLWVNFDSTTAELQFVEQAEWIPAFGIEYLLGLDGLNLFFLLIVAFITPLALLGSWNVSKRNWQFQIQMLLL